MESGRSESPTDVAQQLNDCIELVRQAEDVAGSAIGVSPLVVPPRRELQEAKSEAYVYAWYKRYNELVHFQNAYGHCNVPQNFPLGWVSKQPLALTMFQWVNKQRTKVSKAKDSNHPVLTEHQIQLLDSIGFQWAQPGRERWNSRFAELVSFEKLHGHCRVPTKSGPLGHWVSTQRTNYWLFQKGQKKLLTQERIDKLNEIGFEWQLYGSPDTVTKPRTSQGTK